MDEILNLAMTYAPEDLSVTSVSASIIELSSNKSLFRLKTYLDGAVDMYNAVYTSYRIVWRKVTRNKLVLEELQVYA